MKKTKYNIMRKDETYANLSTCVSLLARKLTCASAFCIALMHSLRARSDYFGTKESRVESLTMTNIHNNTASWLIYYLIDLCAFGSQLPTVRLRVLPTLGTSKIDDRQHTNMWLFCFAIARRMQKYLCNRVRSTGGIVCIGLLSRAKLRTLFQ